MKILYRLPIYLCALCGIGMIRVMPHGMLKVLARFAALLVRPIYPLGKLVRANIRTAMPELPEREVRRICRESFFHLFYNLLEFIWLSGKPERIRRCYYPPPEIRDKVVGYIAEGKRIIFVNPHLGSWEASGVMVPFYADTEMAAVAKPVSNPYLNKLLNSGNREKVKGLRIIFSRGAARTAIKLLREGWSIGLLIDQNTRVRDGGEFVDFFGLPVASSLSPAVLKRYCDAHDIPTVLLYGTSIRHADGRIHATVEELPRPFAEYADDRAVVQEIMNMSERYIRKTPEQYLWLYRRFRNIPPDAPAELRKRYPYYARVPGKNFFRKVKKSPATEMEQPKP